MAKIYRCKLSILGAPEDIKEVESFVGSENDRGVKRAIDFNRILPVPSGYIPYSEDAWYIHKLLYDPANSKAVHTRAVKRELRKFSHSALKAATNLAAQYKRNLEQFGYIPYSSRWQGDNWGTCGNAEADRTEVDPPGCIHFLIGWGVPTPVMIHCSMLFPNVQLQLTIVEFRKPSTLRTLLFHKGVVLSDTLQDLPVEA